MNLTKRGWHLVLHLAGAATLAAFSIAVCPHAHANASYWVGTWGAAPLRAALPDNISQINTVNTQTLRERVRISVSGNQVRLNGRAQAHGLRIYGATLNPFEAKKTTDIGYFPPAKEEDFGTTINEWSRGSGAFDGVIDSDKALRNPQELSGVVRAYLSSDDLHPSAADYRAMAEAVDFSLFQ